MGAGLREGGVLAILIRDPQKFLDIFPFLEKFPLYIAHQFQFMFPEELKYRAYTL